MLRRVFLSFPLIASLFPTIAFAKPAQKFMLHCKVRYNFGESPIEKFVYVPNWMPDEYIAFNNQKIRDLFEQVNDRNWPYVRADQGDFFLDGVPSTGVREMAEKKYDHHPEIEFVT